MGKRLKRSKRNEIIIRDKWQCVKCGRKTSLQVNHIIPHVDGGTNDSENLATLCHPCHLEWHSYELSSVNCSYENFIKWLKYPTVLQIVKILYCSDYQNYKVHEVVSLLQETKIQSEKIRVRNRTKAALESVRARGVRLGRRKALDREGVQRLCRLYDERCLNGNHKYTIEEICEMMGISRSSLYRYLNERKLPY